MTDPTAADTSDPKPIDLVTQLHEVLYGSSWARTESPAAVWAELLAYVGQLNDRLRAAEADLAVARTAAWQFNEAVSLLREARAYVPEFTGCAEDIDDGLPAIDAALKDLAFAASTPTTEDDDG